MHGGVEPESDEQDLSDKIRMLYIQFIGTLNAIYRYISAWVCLQRDDSWNKTVWK